MIFIGAALYMSKQLNTGIRWILLYQLYCCDFFFFSLPYFQIKENETFQGIEHKLHSEAGWTFQHLSFHTWSPPSSSWTVFFLLLGSCGQAAFKGTSASPYKYHQGCSCWRSRAVRPRWLYRYSSQHENHMDFVWLIWRGFSHPWAHDSSAVLCSHPSHLLAHPWGWGRGEVGTQMHLAFPNAEEGWCEMAHLSQPIGKQGSAVSLYRLRRASPPLLSLCCIPDQPWGSRWLYGWQRSKCTGTKPSADTQDF